jgi:hypothetical protein
MAQFPLSFMPDLIMETPDSTFPGFRHVILQEIDFQILFQEFLFIKGFEEVSPFVRKDVRFNE